MFCGKEGLEKLEAPFGGDDEELKRVRKSFFYISSFFRPLFSSFSNRLGETKVTILHFSVTNLNFSFTDLIT